MNCFTMPLSPVGQPIPLACCLPCHHGEKVITITKLILLDYDMSAHRNIVRQHAQLSGILNDKVPQNICTRKRLLTEMFIDQFLGHAVVNSI